MNTCVTLIASIVTYNSESTIIPCIQSLVKQEDFLLGNNLRVIITDNNSSDNTLAIIEQHFDEILEIRANMLNTGFTGANNDIAREALNTGAKYLLMLNPDAVLHPSALKELVRSLELDTRAGSACPKLLRCNSNLEPLTPAVFDSTGIYITPEIRHFDRGSSELDLGQYESKEYVFGASGAAILIKTSFIRDAAIKDDQGQLQLFDSAFFAYREDADLAWRAQWLGWKCIYVPEAIGYHLRHVLPERRQNLHPKLNYYGVRNRFLLQFNNFSLIGNFKLLIPCLWRNFLVLGAISTIERSSFSAFIEALGLFLSARKHFFNVFCRRRVGVFSLNRWFSKKRYSEPLLQAKVASKQISKIQILIINYNSGARLIECLQSISNGLNEIRNSVQIHIRVIDNDSVDNSAKRVESVFTDSELFEFVYSNKNMGFAGAINASYSADADAILILNPDIQITAENIKELILTLNSYESLSVIAPVLHDSHNNVQHGFTVRALPSMMSTIAELFFIHKIFPCNPWTTEANHTNNRFVKDYLEQKIPGHSDIEPYESLDKPLLVEQPAASCLMIRKCVLDELNGFDASFYPAWFEDVDLCTRLKQKNHILAVTNKAHAMHEGGYSVHTLKSGEFYQIFFRNMLRYWKKHGSFFEYLSIRVLFVPALILRSIAWIIDAFFDLQKNKPLAKHKLEIAKKLFQTAVKPCNGN